MTAAHSGNVTCTEVVGGEPRDFFRRTLDIRQARRVEANRYGGCAILEDTTVRCWGDASDSWPVPGLRDVVRLAVDRQACAVRTDGSVWWWSRWK